jgi:hypothetical protein
MVLLGLARDLDFGISSSSEQPPVCSWKMLSLRASYDCPSSGTLLRKRLEVIQYCQQLVNVVNQATSRPKLPSR